MMPYLPRLRIAVLVAGAMLAAATSHAFTLDDGTGKSATPKFDIEEQSSKFRKGDLDMSAIGKNAVETPFGQLQFGVQRETPMFGSPFGSTLGSSSAAQDRRHFDRMLAPPTSRDRYE